jgi:hypothetical protein
LSLRGARPQPLFAVVTDDQADGLAQAVGSLSLAAAVARLGVRPIPVAPAALVADNPAVAALSFACVKFRWRGARAIFDGLDDALA